MENYEKRLASIVSTHMVDCIVAARVAVDGVDKCTLVGVRVLAFRRIAF